MLPSACHGLMCPPSKIMASNKKTERYNTYYNSLQILLKYTFEKYQIGAGLAPVSLDAV